MTIAVIIITIIHDKAQLLSGNMKVEIFITK